MQIFRPIIVWSVFARQLPHCCRVVVHVLPLKPLSAAYILVEGTYIEGVVKCIPL
jgi:hypothetical protein